MVITKNVVIPLCDLRIKKDPEEESSMGLRMSAIYKDVEGMFDSEVKEESEDDDTSFEVRKVQIPKKRIVKIFDVKPKKEIKSEDLDYENNKNEDPDYEASKSEDSDYEDSTSEDPDSEEEIEKKSKRSIKKEHVTYTPVPKVKKNLSAYEEMIKKNREEKMAFLQSLKIEEAKEDLEKLVEEKKKKSMRKIPVKRKFKEPISPPVLRKSRRLANISADLSEDALFSNALKAAEESASASRKAIPPLMSFKDALNDDLYESYVADMSIQESKYNTKFITYDKSDLKNLTVDESNVVKITPARITTLTWYPSPEQLIVAAGDKYGNLGVLNVSNESSPYLMKIHDEGITNLQFSPFNHAQLISSSYDGILRCGDMVQHKFNEIYNVSDTTCCTYFDVLSETTFLVAQKDGHVAVVDSRIDGKSFEKKHVCHDYPIKTVSIHPVNRNVFVSAENRGLIRIWDLRKLQKNPVAETNYHKRAVHAAYFSPVTGHSILTTSADDKISIFDCSDLRKIVLKQCMKHNNQTGRWLSVFRATWLPYSEEAFVIGSMDFPRKIEVYDKNMFAYNIKHEHFLTITSVNIFHPRRHALAAGNSSGKLYVFT